MVTLTAFYSNRVLRENYLNYLFEIYTSLHCCINFERPLSISVSELIYDLTFNSIFFAAQNVCWLVVYGEKGKSKCQKNWSLENNISTGLRTLVLNRCS